MLSPENRDAADRLERYADALNGPRGQHEAYVLAYGPGGRLRLAADLRDLLIAARSEAKPSGDMGSSGAERAARRPSDVCGPPAQLSDGEWRMIHGQWGLFFPSAKLDAPEERMAVSSALAAFTSFMDAAENVVIAWAMGWDLGGTLHVLADVVSHNQPEARINPAESGASGADGQGPPVRRTPAPDAPKTTAKEGEG